MHLLSLASLGLVVVPILAACPYQRDEGENSNISRDFRKTPLLSHSARGTSSGKKGVMLMNRIGPSTSTLYIANTDGTNERQLLNDSSFDYHASFSPDGQWITFTSERNGDGNSDLYRCRADGSALQKVLTTSSFEDSMVLSPNGSQVGHSVQLRISLAIPVVF
jgi:dipeptidyl aminopeptidase/acylaminoacyl peptidase